MSPERTFDELPGRIRTESVIRHGVKESAATICACGGLLAQNEFGVWCLRCETEPQSRRRAS